MKGGGKNRGSRREGCREEGRLGENIMREALRVLRDLYSARHYCRSFVPRVRISSPPPSPAYFHPYCLSSSSLLLLLFLPLPSLFITSPFHSTPPLKTIMLPAQWPPMRIAGERLPIPYPPRYQNGLYDGTLFDYLTASLSLRSFHLPLRQRVE